MNSRPRFKSFLYVTFAIGLLVLPAPAAITNKLGFFGKVPAGQIFQCPQGTFLVGLTQNQTDRIVGVAYVCGTLLPGGKWKSVDSIAVPPDRVGDFKSGVGKNATCPHNFFLIGFRATLGEYRADLKGVAGARPAQLLADLAPVCRDAEGAIFAFGDGRLKQADDNSLVIVNWDGLAGPRTCGAGEAAVGILLSYEAGRDLDPNNRFSDAALLCDRLPVDLTKGITTKAGGTETGNPTRGKRRGNP